MSDLINRLHTAAPKTFPLGALCHEAAAEIASLRSQLDEARRADEWQDISTAPKDWSDVLLFDREYENDHRMVFEGYYDAEENLWRDSHGICVFPTHWRPLPAPPALQSTDGKEVGG